MEILGLFQGYSSPLHWVYQYGVYHTVYPGPLTLSPYYLTLTIYQTTTIGRSDLLRGGKTSEWSARYEHSHMGGTISTVRAHRKRLI